jgi:zinc protease
LIELKDVNGLIKEYVKEDNRVIILTGPEKKA